MHLGSSYCVGLYLDLYDTFALNLGYVHLTSILAAFVLHFGCIYTSFRLHLGCILATFLASFGLHVSCIWTSFLLNLGLILVVFWLYFGLDLGFKFGKILFSRKLWIHFVVPSSVLYAPYLHTWISDKSHICFIFQLISGS